MEISYDNGNKKFHAGNLVVNPNVGIKITGKYHKPVNGIPGTRNFFLWFTWCMVIPTYLLYSYLWVVSREAEKYLSRTTALPTKFVHVNYVGPRAHSI